MNETRVQSSWVKSIGYRRAAPSVKHLMPPATDGFLVLETVAGNRYTWAVPAYLVGLVMAHRSHGRAIGLMVKGKYPSLKLS